MEHTPLSPDLVKPKLLIILGDQLDLNSKALRDLNPKTDQLWMAEVPEESKHVWSHKSRIILFLSAMRHFRDELKNSGYKIIYQEITSANPQENIGDALLRSLKKQPCREVRVVEPGDYRVHLQLQAACKKAAVPLVVLPDDSFLMTTQEFAAYAGERKGLRMEFFYRTMRKRHSILMEGETPAGGSWNYDRENRESLGKEGTLGNFSHLQFKPDPLTRQVIGEVKNLFSDHPGSLEHFDWPVSREQALELLEDFIKNHLADFGRYQDAMWSGQPFLHHSKIAAALNLKLIMPLEVIKKVEQAYRKKKVNIASAEGFIRQVLGWREYVRGIYHLYMPEYLERNALKAQAPLPEFFWSGKTEMNCLREVIEQTLTLGYAHHIQRLMVTGLYCLLLGVNPKSVHEWYLAVYVDAVEWVELPNTLGMSQYADGGVMASKPYIASGKYIQRMSNYCQNCKYRPEQATGEEACPFTTLYWDFVRRHRSLLKGNPRLGAQLKNWDSMDKAKKAEIELRANRLRKVTV